MAREGRDGRDGRDGIDGQPGTNGRDYDPAVLERAVTARFALIPKPRDGKDGRDGINGKDAPLRPAQSYVFAFMRGGDGLTEQIVAEGSDGRDYAFNIVRGPDNRIEEVRANPL